MLCVPAARHCLGMQSRPMRVVIAGAGVAALEAGLALHALAGGLVEVTLVAPDDRVEFRPGTIAQPFGGGGVRSLDILRVVRDVHATLVRGRVTGIDAEARQVDIAGGLSIVYDAVILATGAVPTEAVPGARTLFGLRDVAELRVIIDTAAASPTSYRLVFAIPADVGWALPMYELALLASARLAETVPAPRLAIVTPEARPLAAFGDRASAQVGALLEARRIAFHGQRTPTGFSGGALRMSPTAVLAADCVVALPHLHGPYLAGVPVDADGFIRVDDHGRIIGIDAAYAAGDVTEFPVKQGGIAAAQADAIASVIAADAGADCQPRPFLPVLRGLLVTGDGEHYLEADIASGAGDRSAATTEPLWWPPTKIAGRYIGPYLAALESEAQHPAPTARGMTKEAP